MGHHPWRNTMHPGPIWYTNAGMGHWSQYTAPVAFVAGTWVEQIAAGSVTPISGSFASFPHDGAGGNKNWYSLSHTAGFGGDEFLQLLRVPSDYSVIEEIDAPFAAFDSLALYRGLMVNAGITAELMITGLAADTVSVNAHLAYTATPLTTTSPTWTSVNKFSGTTTPTGFVILSPMLPLVGHHLGQSHMALAQSEVSGDIGIYTWDSLSGTSEVLENTILASASLLNQVSGGGLIVNDSFLAFSFYDNDAQEFVVVGKDPSTSTVLFESRSAQAGGTTANGVTRGSARANITATVAAECEFYVEPIVFPAAPKTMIVTTAGVTSEPTLPSLPKGSGDLSNKQYAIVDGGLIYRRDTPGFTYALQTNVVDSPVFTGGGAVSPMVADRSLDQSDGSAIQVLLDDGSVWTFHPS